MPERRTLWLRGLAPSVLIAVLGAWLWLGATHSTAVAPSAGAAIDIDKSPGAQGDRKRVIDGLVADGLVRRIDVQRGGKVRVSLRAPFLGTNDGMRRTYADVIYRYHFDGSNVNDTIILRDARHGNEVGRYNPYQGGLNMH